MNEPTLNSIGRQVTDLIIGRVFRRVPSETDRNRLHCTIVALLHQTACQAEAERPERQAIGVPTITIRICYDSTDIFIREVCLVFGLAPGMLRRYRRVIVHHIVKAYLVEGIITNTQADRLTDRLLQMLQVAIDPSRFAAQNEGRGTKRECLGK